MPDLERKTLAEWRRERGYSQMGLASAIGVTLATIGNLETGRNRPTFDTVQKLTRELGIIADQIIWPAEVRRYPSKTRQRKTRESPKTIAA